MIKFLRKAKLVLSVASLPMGHWT